MWSLQINVGNELFGCLLDGVAEVPVSLIHIGTFTIRGKQALCKLVGCCNIVTPIGLSEVPALNKANFPGTISEALCCDQGNVFRIILSNKRLSEPTLANDKSGSVSVFQRPE